MRGKSLDTAECADQFTALKSKLTNRVNHIGWPPLRGAGGWRESVCWHSALWRRARARMGEQSRERAMKRGSIGVVAKRSNTY